MVIKSKFLKTLFLVFFIQVYSGCQLLSVHSINKNKNIQSQQMNDSNKQIKGDLPLNTTDSNVNLSEGKATQPVDNLNLNSSDVVVPTKKNTRSNQVPKFGLILSGGGVRTWAHLSVLKNLVEYRFPVVAVAGTEWGSVVAATFAHQGSANETEWELSKFKSIEDWPQFLDQVFAKTSTSDFKINFVCPSLNLKTKNAFLLNRGSIKNFIPFCLPSPGIMTPFNQSVSYFNDLNSIITHLKASGAQKIILVNVLATTQYSSYLKNVDSYENQIWSAYAAQLRKNSSIDETIEIDLSDININDFDSRLDVIEKSKKTSYDQVKKIADKYKL